MSTKTSKIQEFLVTSLTAFLLGPDSCCGSAQRYNGDKSSFGTYYIFEVATLSYGSSFLR